MGGGGLEQGRGWDEVVWKRGRMGKGGKKKFAEITFLRWPAKFYVN